MESINQMRERRNALAKEVRNLLDKHSADAGTWGEAQQKEYDDKLAMVERIDAAIAREQRLLDLAAETHFKDAGGRELEAGKAGNPRAAEGRRILNKWLREGDRALSNEDWTFVRNTMSTTTGSEGGFTVQTDVARTLVQALKEFGGMREVAEVIVTEQGNPLNYPTTNGTAEVGEIVPENVSATDEDASFGTASLNVFKYSSKVITVPIELLQDSTVDIEAMVNARLAERIGRITNGHFTTGTGAGQPRGLVTASGAGKVGATSASPAITYDDLVDLQESVDPAYQRSGRARWMFQQQTRRLIRKIKDNSGRPIFNPGYEVGVPGGAPDTLLGDAIVLNQEMPAPAASAKSVLYGDLGYYKIRDAMAVQLFRFTDSAYTKKGQVGFLAWMRSGGNFIDAGGNAVKHFQHGPAA